MKLQLLVSALLSIGLLCSCSDGGSDAPEGGGGSTDATGGRSPVEEALPQDAYIVGNCSIPAGSRICTLYFGTPDTPQTETAAYDDCRDVDDDVGFSEDWWSPGEPCPTSVEYECRTSCPSSVLESACVFVNRAEFEYSDHSRTLEQREDRCDADGGTFYEF
jgi:hypothetical protein